ncbi:hypothetical protein KR100_09860 [Synechococcus sp. KORDI-100]|nr:hypothetical protein KR100_09860 [Synechococcus sp. KORDI-100]
MPDSKSSFSKDFKQDESGRKLLPIYSAIEIYDQGDSLQDLRNELQSQPFYISPKY